MRATRPRPRALTLALLGVLAMTLSACQPGAPVESVTPSEAPPPVVETLGAVGDSFTAAMNACATEGDCPAMSWSIGTDVRVNSIATRLEALQGFRPQTVSAALSGGDLQDSLDSLSVIIEAEPQLVTVMIGGNDVCGRSIESMTAVDVFADKFATLLGTLSSELPDARLLVLSLPSFQSFWDLARVQPLAPAYWERHGFCASGLGGAASDDPAAVAAREAVTQRVDAFNSIIAAVCATTPNCIGDDGALNAYRFSEAELSSIDYGHPSIAGHAAIADIAWEALVAGSE
jgi:lysophospholipase L1-like esterase